jgi:hypothetical protein
MGYIRGCNTKLALAKSKKYVKGRLKWKNLMQKEKQKE